MAALKTGEADIVNKVPVQEIDAIKSDNRLRLAPVQSNRLAFFGLNTFEPPFDNRTLRLAINHAVDIEAIMQSVLGGYAVRILLAPEIYVGNDPSIKPYPYDVDRAKQLLAEAGYPNGLEITMESAQAGSTPNDSLLAQAVAGQLGRIGIRANIVQADFGAYVQKWLRKEVKGMYLFSFGGPILDMDALMGAHFDSKRRALYYNRPDLDQMVAEAKANFDQNARKAQYSKIIQLIKDDAPWLFMFSADDVYAANTRLKNWEPRADEAVWVHQSDVEG
jgi:peptide/nickel transport system substrate-binding protein